MHEAMMNWIPGQTPHPFYGGFPSQMVEEPPTWNPYQNIMNGLPAGYPPPFNDQGMIPGMTPPMPDSMQMPPMPQMPPPPAQMMAPVSMANPAQPVVPAGGSQWMGNAPYMPQQTLGPWNDKLPASNQLGGGFSLSGMSPQNYLEQLINGGPKD